MKENGTLATMRPSAAVAEPIAITALATMIFNFDVFMTFLH
jgi:hypothetical protein